MTPRAPATCSRCAAWAIDSWPLRRKPVNARWLLESDRLSISPGGNGFLQRLLDPTLNAHCGGCVATLTVSAPPFATGISPYWRSLRKKYRSVGTQVEKPFFRVAFRTYLVDLSSKRCLPEFTHNSPDQPSGTPAMRISR